MFFFFFFFFQAEDGIRDGTVTGVQTCALPIWQPHQALGVPNHHHALPAPRPTPHGDPDPAGLLQRRDRQASEGRRDLEAILVTQFMSGSTETGRVAPRTAPAGPSGVGPPSPVRRSK